MRAIYESTQPYLQVGFWDVNATVPVYSGARETKSGVIIAPEEVGTIVNLPESELERNRSYLFSEGEKHNQLTLTDPREILNMRDFIKGREITELYCEGDPVEELRAMEAVEEDLSDELEEDLEDPEDNTYNEWDEKMAERLKY